MKSYSDPIKEVEVLTSQILDNNYSKEVILRLSHLLKSSREARKRYTELTIQDSLLHWESVDYENEAKADKDKKIFISFPIISSIAAAVVALLSVWWIHSSRTKPIISLKILFKQILFQIVRADRIQLLTFEMKDLKDLLAFQHLIFPQILY